MSKSVNLIFAAVLALGPISSRASGLPGPWPFPWAKECPILWQEVDGAYAFFDSQDKLISWLKITIKPVKAGANPGYLLEAVLMDDGNLPIGFGVSRVSVDDRRVAFWLLPTDGSPAPIRAVIKFHYASSVRSCSRDRLVPVLTVGRAAYRLEKIVPPQQ